MRSVLRHLIPVCVTTLAILLSAVVITLPIAGVFLIDGAFVVSDYLKFLLSAAGVGVAVSSLVLFPLSLLLERLSARVKLLAVAFPLILLLVSGACLLGGILLTGQFFRSVFGWAGLFFACSVAFGVYWVVLWLQQGVVHGLRSLGRRIQRQSENRA